MINKSNYFGRSKRGDAKRRKETERTISKGDGMILRMILSIRTTFQQIWGRTLRTRWTLWKKMKKKLSNS